jgi:hypothetical protein
LLLIDAPGQHEEEAIRLLESCAKDDADVAVDEGQKLGDLAKPLLFRLRFLSIGKTAPEIEAEDVEGKKLKLERLPGQGGAVGLFRRLVPARQRRARARAPGRAGAREPAVRAPGGEL